MIRCLILLASVLASSQASGPMERKIKNKIDTYNILAACWGEGNMLQYVSDYYKAVQFCQQLQAPLFSSNSEGPLLQGFQQLPANENQLEILRLLVSNPTLASLLLRTQSSPNNLFRSKREEKGILQWSEEDKAEFLSNLDTYKATMESKIGNLTCVMTQLKMLDAEGEINMAYYREDVWNEIDRRDAAVQDPVFVQRMKNGYDDCYEISQGWPQQSLDRNPIFKKYGKHMIFFECAKKLEHKMCYMYEMKLWMEGLYGDIDTRKFGPNMDKYDAAVMGLKVLYESATPEERFVDEALWGMSKL